MSVNDTKRIQKNIINSLEKKVLVFLAERMPKWVNSDMLTFTGFVGSLMICAGFILTHLSINWLWLAIAGLVVNWFGDSLDGTLARVRQTQRPVYGYYLDHTMDVVNELFMFVGIGLSPLVHLHIAMAALIFYLALTLNVSMNSYLRSEFKLSYAGLGPTEFRMIIIFICLLFIYVPCIRDYARTVQVFDNTFVFGMFDYIALAVAAVLGVIWAGTIIQDIKHYAKVDPPKKRGE